MPNEPLVSIGLPTYNRALTLRRAIESALAQDYQNIELVISDNASTDETSPLCAEVCAQDKRVKYIRQPSNRGVIANFREALDQSTGEFFMWLSDDDWISPSYVSQCVRVFIEERDYSLVGGVAHYYQDDKFLFEGAKINLLQDDGSERVLGYYQQVENNGIFHGVMKREMLSKTVLQETLAGDWLLIASMAYLGKVRVVQTATINRSLKGASANLEKVALSMGLSKFQSRNPFVTIAWIVFKDIAWKSPIYNPLGTWRRIRLGWQAAQAIGMRFFLPSWGLRTQLKRTLRSI